MAIAMAIPFPHYPSRHETGSSRQSSHHTSRTEIASSVFRFTQNLIAMTEMFGLLPLTVTRSQISPSCHSDIL
jgi:hypothetical protein